MTAVLNAARLVGRQHVLEKLLAAPSAVVTGWVGAGRSTMLACAARRGPAATGLVVTVAPLQQEATEPLSYLSRLTVRTGPRAASTALAAGAAREGDLLVALESLVDRLSDAAAGRRTTLVLDDLHLADAQSLMALPWLARRTGAAVLASVRVPEPGRRPGPDVARALARLDLAAHVHLPPLDELHVRELLKARSGHGPAPALLARLETRLGAASGQPGLVLAAAHSEALAATHPLVRELRSSRSDAALVALALPEPGLDLRLLDPLAAALRCDADALADDVDRLTTAGWLAQHAGCWKATVPALARALAPAVPTVLRRAAAGAPAGPAGRIPVPAGVRTRSDRVTEQVASMLRRGMGNAAIAGRLGLSEKTVEGYVTRLLTAHGCTNRTQLTARLLAAPEPAARTT